MADKNGRAIFRLRGRTVEIFGRSLRLPESRLGRMAIGVALLLGGFLSFLPILGIWMLPLGLWILSMDIAVVRRWRRRIDVRWTRWRAARKARKEAEALARR